MLISASMLPLAPLYLEIEGLNISSNSRFEEAGPHVLGGEVEMEASTGRM